MLSPVVVIMHADTTHLYPTGGIIFDLSGRLMSGVRFDGHVRRVLRHVTFADSGCLGLTDVARAVFAPNGLVSTRSAGKYPLMSGEGPPHLCLMMGAMSSAGSPSHCFVCAQFVLIEMSVNVRSGSFESETEDSGLKTTFKLVTMEHFCRAKGN